MKVRIIEYLALGLSLIFLFSSITLVLPIIFAFTSHFGGTVNIPIYEYLKVLAILSAVAFVLLIIFDYVYNLIVGEEE